jgi:hypothetical protein
MIAREQLITAHSTLAFRRMRLERHLGHKIFGHILDTHCCPHIQIMQIILTEPHPMQNTLKRVFGVRFTLGLWQIFLLHEGGVVSL